jgi:DNA modification methylase
LIYSEFKNLAVWVKGNAGLGSFYRSKHELIGIFKKGHGPHLNNFGLGANGRYRTNVWQYAGINSFKHNRAEELDMHPTVKPVALVMDAIKDVTKRGQIVLDGFVGSGTTIVAAEKTGRVARAVEIDAAYVDVSIQRWQRLTKQEARLASSDESFLQVAHKRSPGSAQSIRHRKRFGR